MTQLRFALAQIDTCVGALDANAAKVLDYSRKAAAGNAQERNGHQSAFFHEDSHGTAWSL